MAIDTGRSSRKGAVRKRSQRQTNDGTEALDQAQPIKRRVHVAKKSSTKKIQRRPAREGLTRQLSDGKELSSCRKYWALGYR